MLGYFLKNGLITCGQALIYGCVLNFNTEKVPYKGLPASNQKESLLGKIDAEALGIIKIDKKGSSPSISKDEGVARLKPTIKTEKKSGVMSGGQDQATIDKNMKKIEEEFKDLFTGIGKVQMEPIHIFIKEGVKTVAQKQRTVARHYMEPLKKHLEELKAEDVIEGPLGSKHATGWVSNVVLTAKKYDVEEEEGKTGKSNIRMNLDTRFMNKAVKAVHFPIPTSEQLRHEFQGSDRYSVLDMNHSFHQFVLDEESRQLFTFTTPYGLFRFKRLVMGTPPASGECHSRIRKVIQGLDGVVQIKDDVVIHGKGEKHDKRLKAVLQRFKEYGLTLRKEKFKLGKTEVLWFGNIFSEQPKA